MEGVSDSLGGDDEPARELYAMLHLSPDADDEDIKRAYRQWAQVYHPDKHQSVQMQDIATQNFQRIREAYEILSDPRKRQIYDLYGLEGLSSGLELGPKLKSRDEIRKEFERLQLRKQERNLALHVHQAGSLALNINASRFIESWDSPPRLSGMAMSSSVQAQLSSKDTVVLGGNMAMRGGMGGGSVTAAFRRQLSTISSVEFVSTIGLRSILTAQASRQLSSHSTGTMGASLSLRDGSVTLTNAWTRQLGQNTAANIQLAVGPEATLAVGWQHNGSKNGGSGELKVTPSVLGISGHYVRHFSSKSRGRVTGKLGSSGVEVEVGGERRVSEHSSAAMFCTISLQGVLWKIRYTRGGHKFVIPILLSTSLNPLTCLGALVVPSSIYTLLKVYVLKPYYLRRERRKTLEQRRSTISQVLEARRASEKAQALLQHVAERKRRKQAKAGGLVITEALYGNLKPSPDVPANEGNGVQDDLPPPNLDVTVPLQFLVDETGHQLLLYEGVKKSGLMGFCDPCPGEPKELRVAYTYQGSEYLVVAGDTEELRIPQERHRCSSTDVPVKLNQVD